MGLAASCLGWGRGWGSNTGGAETCCRIAKLPESWEPTPEPQQLLDGRGCSSLELATLQGHGDHCPTSLKRATLPSALGLGWLETGHWCMDAAS